VEGLVAGGVWNLEKAASILHGSTASEHSKSAIASAAFSPIVTVWFGGCPLNY